MFYIKNYILCLFICLLSLANYVNCYSQSDNIQWRPYHTIERTSTNYCIVLFYNSDDEWSRRQKRELEKMHEILSPHFLAILWDINSYRRTIFYGDRQYNYRVDLGYHEFFNHVTNYFKGTPYILILDNSGTIVKVVSGFTKERTLRLILAEFV